MLRRSRTTVDTDVRLFEREDINRTIQLLDKLIHYFELKDEIEAMEHSHLSREEHRPSQMLIELRNERLRLVSLWHSCDPGPRELFRQEHPELKDSGNFSYCGNPDCGGQFGNYSGEVDRQTHERMWGGHFPDLTPSAPPEPIP